MALPRRGAGLTAIYWTEERDKLALACGGQYPKGELEDEILKHFQEAPQLVVQQMQHVAAAFKAGKIHSPWVILKMKLEERGKTMTEVIAYDTGERERRTRQAEQYVRNVSHMFPNWEHMEDELFYSPNALLKSWAGDDGLRLNMMELFESHWIEDAA